MKYIKTFEEFVNESEQIDEAAKAIYGLANIITYANKNDKDFSDSYDVPLSILKQMKQLGIISKTAFEMSSLFPRDTFKIEDIVSGKLAAQIKRTHFDGPDQTKELEKAEVLKQFVQALDDNWGDRSWTKGF